MRAYKPFLLLVLFFLAAVTQAQDKYWVVFKDKKNVNFNPYEYFDQKVIKKREVQGIPLVQFSDLPLNTGYCNDISRYADISLKSRWLNAVAVSLDNSDIEKIKDLQFVKEVRKMSLVSRPAEYHQEIDSALLDHLHQQIEVFGEKLLREKGLDGSGVRIAVFDGGFPAVDGHK